MPLGLSGIIGGFGAPNGPVFITPHEIFSDFFVNPINATADTTGAIFDLLGDAAGSGNLVIADDRRGGQLTLVTGATATNAVTYLANGSHFKSSSDRTLVYLWKGTIVDVTNTTNWWGFCDDSITAPLADIGSNAFEGIGVYQSAAAGNLKVVFGDNTTETVVDLGVAPTADTELEIKIVVEKDERLYVWVDGVLKYSGVNQTSTPFPNGFMTFGFSEVTAESASNTSYHDRIYAADYDA